MKKTILLLFALTTSTLAFTQIVNIPDTIFKAYLVGNTAINTNGDTEIQLSEAQAFTGTINEQLSSVTDATGIEAFTALTDLRLSHNALTSLDLSQNVALENLSVAFNSLTSLVLPATNTLTTINCYNNLLTTIDVSQNPMLTYLGCHSNALTSLDLSQNTQLDLLYCFDNALSAIDVSQNTLLTTFYCYDNQLTSIDITQNTLLSVFGCHRNAVSTIDVSFNTALTTLWLADNLFTDIDLSNNTNLLKLYCHNNMFTNIDVSQNINLNHFYCFNNVLNSLDLSNHSALTRLRAEDNELIELNIANGNNMNIDTGFFKISGNPDLSCVEVDDVAYANTHFLYKDLTTSYSLDCFAFNNTVLVSAITVQGMGGDSTISVNGGTLQMEATVLPANATDASFTWSVNNGTGTATIDNNGLLTASTNGTVEVMAAANDTSGTVGTKTITISNQSVGINDLAFENLSVFPNPTSGVINIETFEKPKIISILDLTGKQIKTFSGASKTLDISAFTTGIYFLEIANEERKSVFKIIKK